MNLLIFLSKCRCMYLKPLLNSDVYLLLVPLSRKCKKLHLPFHGLLASQLVCKQCATKVNDSFIILPTKLRQQLFDNYCAIDIFTYVAVNIFSFIFQCDAHCHFILW